jgi:hypothetical protein
MGLLRAGFSLPIIAFKWINLELENESDLNNPKG